MASHECDDTNLISNKYQSSSLLNNESLLTYSIHKYSSFSTNYSPENILIDRPSDQSSRWSSDSNHPPQYLILKLSRPAIVKEITFGKYEKTHVCNLKKFKIYGGMSDDTMIELLDSGLKNDCNCESFLLKHTINNNQFPCRYVKIVPIQSWGPSFNFSIWYVNIKGDDDLQLVRDALKWFNEYRQREAIRLCLKHLRQHNYCEAFESLQKRTKVQLESELLTKLHKLLVIDGNYNACELLLEDATRQGMFDSYLRRQEYRPMWKPIIPSERSERPGMRGGHQMCIDPYAEMIYLFGGWDGTQDLADLWSYHSGTGEWICVSKDTSVEGGPSARSCHKMCLDPQRKKIFTLGRYLDSAIRCADNLKSDFYVYDIESNKWTLITEDTLSMGGPRLVFDHQMCMDIEKNTIYVFGGRIIICPDEKSPNCPDQPQFSGLYSYHVSTNTWNNLRSDSSANSFAESTEIIKSRIGHSMLFHESLRLLYIFAGQRQKEYLSDFFTYNVDTNEIEMICDGERTEVPAAGFTQRATIDSNSHEIHVLSGLNKDRDKKEDTVKNSFWVYDILQNRWSCIYRNENSDNNMMSSNGEKTEPCPRFAHQLVYDHIKKVHYLFGGNPGRSYSAKLRLDDFWTLELSRISRNQLLRRCKRLIREQTYKEIIQIDETAAVRFLQNDLSDSFDHSDAEEIKAFQSLASLIFKETGITGERVPDLDPDINYINRTKVFDAIVEYFPEHMTQPKGNLVDLVIV